MGKTKKKATSKKATDELETISDENDAPTQSVTVKTGKPQSEQETNPETTKFEDLKDNKDFAKFMAIQAISGNLPESPNDTEKKQLLADYNNWLNQGKPLPQISEKVKAKIPAVEKVYRLKHLGTQYLKWITSDGNIHGVEQIPKYRMVKSGNQQIEDHSMIIGYTPNYIVPYTKSTAESLIEHALKECVDPKFFIVENASKYVIQDPQTNFNKDFDDLIRRARTGNPL